MPFPVIKQRFYLHLYYSTVHSILNSHSHFNCICISLSVLTAIFQINLGQPVFTEAKDDGGDGDNWTTGAISRAKLHSNHHHHQQTMIQFFYRPDALPVAQPTVSKHWMENITFHGLAYPSSPGGVPTLSLATNSSWLPWGGLPCLSSALWFVVKSFYFSMFQLFLSVHVSV